MKGYEIQQVQMQPPRFKVDGSSTLSFHTGELSKEHEQLLLDCKGLLGTLLFAPEKLLQPSTQIDSSYDGKSPAERLRNVIFVLWKQEGEQGDFNQYYARTIEKFIDHIKSKLI